jgi:hypothetical protein
MRTTDRPTFAGTANITLIVYRRDCGEEYAQQELMTVVSTKSQNLAVVATPSADPRIDNQAGVRSVDHREPLLVATPASTKHDDPITNAEFVPCTHEPQGLYFARCMGDACMESSSR